MSCLGQLHSFSRNGKMYSTWVRKTQEEFHLLSNVAHFTLLSPSILILFKFPLSQGLQKGLPQGDFGFQRVIGASSSWQVASELLDPGEVELVQVQVDTLGHLRHLEPSRWGVMPADGSAMGIWWVYFYGLWMGYESKIVKTSRNFALMGSNGLKSSEIIWNLWCSPSPSHPLFLSVFTHRKAPVAPGPAVRSENAEAWTWVALQSFSVMGETAENKMPKGLHNW